MARLMPELDSVLTRPGILYRTNILIVLLAVIPPHHAQLVQWEMIWYVGFLQRPAAARPATKENEYSANMVYQFHWQATIMGPVS